MRTYEYGALTPIQFLRVLETNPDDVCINVELKLPTSRKITTIKGTAPAVLYLFENILINDKDIAQMILDGVRVGHDGLTLTVSAFDVENVIRFARYASVGAVLDVLCMDEEDLIITDADPKFREQYTVCVANHCKSQQQVMKIHYSSDVVHDGTVDNHLMQELHSTNGLILYIA